MKVETHHHVEAKGETKASEVAQQDLQELVIMKLLEKASKSIVEDAHLFAQAAAQAKSEKSSGKSPKSSQSAPAPRTDDQSRTHKESESNAILEAFLDQLQTSHDLSKISQETIQALITYINKQMEGLDQLKKEIQSLQNQLKGELTPAQIKQIKSELATLEAAYDAASSSYNSAHSDYQKQQAAEKAAQEAYNQAQQAYNKLPDKSSPQAKALQKEMAQDKASEKAAQSAMASDQTKMDTATKAMNTAASGVNALAQKYPELKENLEALYAAMEKHGSIGGAVSRLDSQLSGIVSEDDKLQKELSTAEAQVQQLAEILSHGSDAIKKAIEQFLNGNRTVDIEKLMQVLVSFLNSQLVQNSHEINKENDKEMIATVTHHSRVAHHERPTYRHQYQRATHDKAAQKG